MVDKIKKTREQYIAENITLALGAAKQEVEGYNCDLTLAKYKTFLPFNYDSLLDMVADVIAENRGRPARILEIGCGEGRVAAEIVDRFGRKISYDALDVVNPKREDVTWIPDNIDEFQPEEKYDLIFSVNGIIYGHDDFSNFFKYASTLYPGGRFFFNFPAASYSDTILEIAKCEGKVFDNFLTSNTNNHFVTALYEAGLHSWIEVGINAKYFGKRNNNEYLDPEQIQKRAAELKEAEDYAYVPEFGQPLARTKSDKLVGEIKDILDREAFKLFDGLNPSSSEKARNTFRTYIPDENMAFTDLLFGKIPINLFTKYLYRDFRRNYPGLK